MSMWDYLPAAFSSRQEHQKETAADTESSQDDEKKDGVPVEPILVVESKIMQAGGAVHKEAWIELDATDTPPEAETNPKDQKQWNEWLETLDNTTEAAEDQKSSNSAAPPLRHTSLSGHSRVPTPPLRSDSPSIGWSVMVADDMKQQFAEVLDIDSLDQRGGMRETTREELLRLRKECTDLFEHLKAMQHDVPHDVDAILKERNQQQAQEIQMLKQECGFLYGGMARFHRELQARSSDSSSETAEAFTSSMTQTCSRCSQTFLLNTETSCVYHTLPLPPADSEQVWPCCNSSGPDALGCVSARHCPSAPPS